MPSKVQPTWAARWIFRRAFLCCNYDHRLETVSRYNWWQNHTCTVSGKQLFRSPEFPIPGRSLTAAGQLQTIANGRAIWRPTAATRKYSPKRFSFNVLTMTGDLTRQNVGPIEIKYYCNTILSEYATYNGDLFVSSSELTNTNHVIRRKLCSSRSRRDVCIEYQAW